MSQPANNAVVTSTAQNEAVQPTPIPAPSTRGGGRGRGRGGRVVRGGNPPDSNPKPAPVQAPGQDKTGKAPSPYSGTPSFTAWGTPPIQQSKRRVRQTIYIDGSGFEDMVETEYEQLTAKHATSARKIPRSIFKYSAFMAFWSRALSLKLSNNNRVSQQEREAMRVLESLTPNIQLPTRIAQYLQNLGNFDHVDGQRLEIVFPDYDFSRSGGTGEERGFIAYPRPNNNTTRVPTPAESFMYGRYPIPGVIAMAISRELDLNSNNQITAGLTGVTPTVASFGQGATQVHATPNIIGHDTAPIHALHNSWAATISSLGWTVGGPEEPGIPPDAISNWLISPGTLRWLSDNLRNIQSYPMTPWSDINKNNSGAYIQLGFIDTTELQSDPLPPEGDLILMKGSLHFDTQLKSPKPIASSHLGPAIACGYRRRIRFGEHYGVANTTLSAPFLPYDNNNHLTPFPAASMIAANAEFNVPGPIYNAESYETTPSTRALLLRTIII